jgi:hypothetical protein
MLALQTWTILTPVEPLDTCGQQPRQSSLDREYLDGRNHDGDHQVQVLRPVPDSKTGLVDVGVQRLIHDRCCGATGFGA